MTRHGEVVGVVGACSTDGVVGAYLDDRRRGVVIGIGCVVLDCDGMAVRIIWMVFVG